MPDRRPSPRVIHGPRRLLHALVAITLIAGSVLVAAPKAYAEDPGSLTIDKRVVGFTDGQQVEPGDTFVYTLTITCTNIGSGGCTSAQLVDPLPEGLSLNTGPGNITIVPAQATASADGGDITIDFTQPLPDPAGAQGIQAGTTFEIQVPVIVDEDISPELNGEDLTNTATVDGTNTNPVSDSFTVVPNVPVELEASTDKSFDPDDAVADPGTETTMTLTGGNASNVAVDEITMTDPASPPGAFTYLGLTGDLDVTLPDGAEQVQVDVWVNGAWVNGPPGPPPAALPDEVDPDDVQGVRIHFISTDADGIPPGAEGSIDVDLVQRDNIADAGEGPITNEVSTTVTDDGTESDPTTADDDYTITVAEIDLEATKDFNPNTIAAGGQSTVTIGATNSSNRTLDTLSITEPGGDPNMFENGLTFDGWGGVQWPEGATGASVQYTYADGSDETLVAVGPNTLPDPDPSKQVVGFTVTFTGPITPGAEASIPFTVTADETQDDDQIDHPNSITANSSAPGGFTGRDVAGDTLTTIIKRLDVVVGKRIIPGQLFSIPGQQALVRLSGQVSAFPVSTTDANQIIVSDPADPSGDTWYDYFAPTGVVQTPIPADSTMTVQYWDGTQWVDVPGMVDLAGPQIYSGQFPPEVSENAQGIRFVYDSDEGFPPGTQVNPNLGFELKPEAAGQEIEVPDCASAGAASDDDTVDDASDAQTPPDCPVIDLVPPDPGNGDLIDKDWDTPKAVGERTGDEAGLTINWSTGGATGIDQVVISDVAAPSIAGLPTSVFDSFDLVRIDPITAAMDPLLTFDRVARVDLYSSAADAWIRAPGDPCPAACDGRFPGYTLNAASQADTLAFRLVFEESPTRGQRNDDPEDPRVGSGVARSAGNNRDIHPVFRIRDELRSDAEVPVIADEEYNVAGEEGEVRNDARGQAVVDDAVLFTDDASDIIAITDVSVTADITKDWSGGPLGVPAPGTASFPDQYPTGRVTLAAKNTTPRKVDRLTVTEPVAGSTPFEQFNLRGFVGITEPTSIGATDVVITLRLAGGGTRTLTRAEALAATEAELTPVIGFTVVYTGRIVEAGTGTIVFDTRLRQTNRTSNTPITADATVTDVASTEVADLVGYPNVPERTSTDAASDAINLVATGIGIQVAKTIAPASQTEPDRAPVAVQLSGQPSGPSRTNRMVLTDEDATFFNQYDFVGFGSFAFTAPIDRVQVDALTGGTFAVAGDTVTNTGSTWVTGTAGTALVLPAGVAPAQVQGLRFTFTRADGAIWENPSTPLQNVSLQMQRRETLQTGGPVETDLGDPAPGEENAGEASNTVQGANQGADIGPDGEPIGSSDDATDTIDYLHSRNAVRVTKSPSGAQQPSSNIPYKLTFTNTGDTPIVSPVITDQLPSDATGPLLIIDPDLAPGTSPFAYDLSGADPPNPPTGVPMPEDPALITVEQTATSFTWTFRPDAVLEKGQTYTITVALRFRPGLPGNTQVTNTTGITDPQRPWDTCQGTLNRDTGACEAATTVYPTRAGALRGVKSVKAVDDELGVLNTRNNPAGCVPDAAGFYVGGCVPVTKPGGDEVWRMTFTNTGNLPQDKVYAVDRLPVRGDTGAITPLPRDSRWRPIPKALRYAGVTGGAVSAVRVFFDTDQDICIDDLTLGDRCSDGEWDLILNVPNPTVGGEIPIPANATAIKIEGDFFDQMLQPNGTVTVELITTTPAQSPDTGADTVAWNTVAAAARTIDGNQQGLSPRSEGNKVGVALATGPLEIRKQVEGPAAEYAPDSFELTARCTSAVGTDLEQEVDLGDRAEITVVPGEVSRIDNIPWGSECTVTENTDDAGNPDFEATTVTIVSEGQTVPIVIATNTYPDASLVIAKADSEAEDENGDPIVYGPFAFRVDCTYLGEPVYADGYGPENPMTTEISSGETSEPFTELPAGAACFAVETDPAGASSTTSEVTRPESSELTGGTTIGPLTLVPDGANAQPTNEVTFSNVFATGSVTITKTVEGPGADLYDVGPFFVELRCVDSADPSRVVFDGETQLGGDQPLSVTVDDLYVDSSCEVTETGTGGATTSTVSPEGPFEVTAKSAQTPVAVTITNRFDVGSIRVIKKIDGDASQVADDKPFVFQLGCQLLVNGEPAPVELADDGVFTLSVGGGLTQQFDDLPTGAVCTVTETENGGADESVVEPGEVTVGDGTTVDVLATNTFDPPDDGDDGSDDDGSDTSSGGTLPNTGGPSLIFLTLGAGLLLAGGGALLASRRRRRRP